ncbi:exodeoxyribonuclease V subunit gamma [Kineosporia sp. J2-2]|uniref:RecBCD enzyme subunit RecC n=1 Tax=Kineosporia corallincola TaxID=2835133 RepID=A0ABS5TBJ2_9ACTN|nr:exodeoxyribonuclease V subunit gamma [Kineosporia corallincola]MBT0767576.1 exodeoxyribonuclease V subunit gamma [Kineosporia corallincola]
MLTVHRCADGTVLAQALGEVLATPLADPFAVETVAVPAKGVERWLTQRLSHTLGSHPLGPGSHTPAAGTRTAPDGVCANVDLPSPAALLEQALHDASDRIGRSVSAWSPDRARWPLVEVIDACRGESWCAALDRHLTPGDSGRRLAVATRLARLFDEYGQARPEMLIAWAAGRDEFGDGQRLHDDLLWQAELWRRLRARLDRPAPAELLDEACATLRDEPARSALPQRLSIFGASRLSPARVRVLHALAEHRDVHLWLHHPSPSLWQATDGHPPAVRRADDDSRTRVRNPLLASMSRDLLELQQTLLRHAPGARHLEHPAPTAPGTLLGHLQHDLHEGLTKEQDDRPVLHPDDTSVQVHACYGQVRQVEVLREVIVGLLADDPGLDPGDILVMCPDVDTFAPIIASVFATAQDQEDNRPGGHPAARLRVRVADRSPRQTNALFDVLGLLLDLGTARITAPQVLDLAGRDAVRRRFGFDDDDLARMRDWLVGAGIRWGLDDSHRQAWHLSSIRQGTWRAGLDRLLLGVAIEGDTAELGGVIGMDDVDSADIDLAGRLAELVDRLGAAQRLMSAPHPVPEWLTGLETAVLGLAGTDRNTAWEVNQLRSELWDLAEAAGDSPAPCTLSDIRAVLGDLLAGRPTRSSFRTGTLTVCTLVPMRSVPHRVICLLGLDDGAFPRRADPDGDDVLARDPWIGERDPRSEDRQLFIDAVCAARERLVITYSGADDRTGTAVPPAVPLGELLDALDRTAWVDRGRVRDRITVRHPLQPFDPRNFTPGALGRPGPFSFDRPALHGAQALEREKSPAKTFLDGVLPAPARPADIDLADLHRLLQHPARGFLRQRLQVGAALAEDEPDDSLPVELDGLARWAVGERLLRQRLSGLSPAECIAVELRRGLLPPGELGRSLLAQVGRQVEQVLTASRLERAQAADSRDVDVALPDGSRLTGTVGGVRGQTVLGLTFSRLGPKHRLTAWIDLLALTATHAPANASAGWSAVAVGRGRGGAARSVFEPVPDALTPLAELVGLYRSGLCSPLPLPLKTGAAYAARRFRRSLVSAARAEAQKQWFDDTYPGEQSDAEHELIYGEKADLERLFEMKPEAGEQGEGWAADESDRFGRLSRRLWDRLLAAERMEGR